jgi:hypothetical protein
MRSANEPTGGEKGGGRGGRQEGRNGGINTSVVGIDDVPSSVEVKLRNRLFRKDRESFGSRGGARLPIREGVWAAEP